MAGAPKARVRSSVEGSDRLVIKIGSSLLVNGDDGRLNLAWVQSLAEEIGRLHDRGQQVLVVSSGAIALGRRYLGMAPEQRRLEDHQAAAAAGQILLAHAYQDLLGQRGLRVAQVLLTLDDTENRRRYLNARSTLETLLKLGVVPVINENDTVATQEIRYGDNDRLAARVAEMTSADCLVLLSDVDGLYDADPAESSNARLIPEVEEITQAIESLAGRIQHGIRFRRNGDQAGCGAHLCRGGLRDGDSQRPLSEADRRDRIGCAMYVVPAPRDAARRAQAMDRGQPDAARLPGDRHGCGAGAACGPKSAAGRRGVGQWRFPAGRRGDSTRAGWTGSRTGARCVLRRRYAYYSGQA